MKISSHADHTEALFGIRAEDIHKWIDGFFESESLGEFLQSGRNSHYNPYEHRKFRHCREALEDAYAEFEGKYSREQIQSVFEQHLKDDYNGYLPQRSDFTNGAFKEKYHDHEELAARETILSKIELEDYFKGKAYLHRKEHNKKRESTFHFHIVLPTVIAIILFVVAIFTVEIPVFRQIIVDRKKEMIRELTLAATSIVDRYIEQEIAGQLTRSQAQEKAISDIQVMRYGQDNKDYFWITDMHPRMILHPYRPDLVGQDLSDYQDSQDRSGKKLFVEFVNIVRAHGEGYLEYHWQWMDDATKVVPKLSYVRAIPRWGWIIGTGVYIHDVQEEIDRITTRLTQIFVLIALLLFMVIIYVVAQSHRIEKDRRRAEAGLLEAKERYRALVEASNEGHLLVIEGESIFSNLTLQRMLGYSEEELAGSRIWSTLLPDIPVNQEARAHIEQLLAGQITAGEFEAQIITKSGTPLDVILRTSRIFFSEKNGHILSIRKITARNPLLQNHSEKLPRPNENLPADLIREIQNSKSSGHIIHTLNRQGGMVKEMMLANIPSHTIRQAVCTIFEATMRRFIQLTIDQLNTPQVEFTWLTLGSNARHEMTLFSDQDNALIFDNQPPEQLESIRLHFLKLADRVCTLLDRAGYPFCPGGIMAVNPTWCLTLDEWKKRFTDRIESALKESILDIHTIFDIRCLYGSETLAEALKQHMISATNNHPEFLLHFARNCLSYQPPLNVFGRIRTEEQNGIRAINIKDCIIPIVNFARIYALKNGITAPATVQRLEQLKQRNLIQGDTCRDMLATFEQLWRLRFYNQIICHEDLRRVNDELDIDKLADSERQALREALARISIFQTRLSYDFLGIAQI